MVAPRSDVLIVGAGPAGLALAAACGERGLATLCVAPAPGAPWRPTYSCWEHELAGLEVPIARRWSAARVRDHGGRLLRIPRPYVQLDKDALQGALRERCERVGVRLVAARVSAVDADARGVATSAGHLPSRQVVDASGHASPFLRRRSAAPLACQLAYGLELEVAQSPWPDDEMVLMDWRPAGRGGSFLYALPAGPRRIFVEETCLASVAPPTLAELRAALLERLERDGVEVAEERSVERCRIPMNPPLPRFDQPLLGFGAAAGHVHPATGYLVAGALHRAPRVAAGLAAALGRRRRPPARALWRLVWPARERRRNLLQRMGLQMLLALPGARLGAFFRAFFSLPDRCWASFLAADGSAWRDLRTMMRLSLHLREGLLWSVLVGSLRGGHRLLTGRRSPLVGADAPGRASEPTAERAPALTGREEVR